MPTPGGVPVVITSPGSSVMYCDTSATSSATPKIIVFVLPSAALAVDVEPHVEVLHVLDLVGRDHPGPERAERVAALALAPLRRALLQLELALRHVVDQAVAGDVLQRVLLRRRSCALRPITMPSSTSQSSCVESFGIITLSFGPTMHVGDLKNTIGFSGIGEPVSFAWSM